MQYLLVGFRLLPVRLPVQRAQPATMATAADFAGLLRHMTALCDLCGSDCVAQEEVRRACGAGRVGALFAPSRAVGSASPALWEAWHCMVLLWVLPLRCL